MNATGAARRVSPMAILQAPAISPVRTNTLNRAKRETDFNAQDFLDSAGEERRIAHFQRNDTIFAQGDTCTDVMYIQKGIVKISVVSENGKEAVVAMLHPGDFVGEDALAGQPVRMATASAATHATLLVISLKKMTRLLHSEQGLSDHFISYMLQRNMRMEEDLIAQLFDSSEKRLARTLLFLARYGRRDKHQWVLPKVSQKTLAEMVGTTRPRINAFMNKFRKLGFIHYDGALRVNDALLSVLLRDGEAP